MGYYRYLFHRVKNYPYRRPRGFATYEETVPDPRGEVLDLHGPDMPLGHREVMYLVSALLALLVLGLIVAFVVLGLTFT